MRPLHRRKKWPKLPAFVPAVGEAWRSFANGGIGKLSRHLACSQNVPEFTPDDPLRPFPEYKIAPKEIREIFSYVCAYIFGGGFGGSFRIVLAHLVSIVGGDAHGEKAADERVNRNCELG